jgi:hypothetical protein
VVQREQAAAEVVREALRETPSLTPEQAKDVLRDAGFEDVKVITDMRDHDLNVPTLVAEPASTGEADDGTD